jgi:hypothetical protein
MTHKALIRQLQISCLGLDPVDPLRLLVDDVVEALREHAMREVQRLGQEIEQEPVAWMFQHDETGRMNYVSNDGIHNPTMFLEMNPRYAFVCALYTTPPQRTWVGLTVDEIEQMGLSNYIKVVRETEAKLKQLNT